MLLLRTGPASGSRTPVQLGAEIINMINAGTSGVFTSVVREGQLPECTLATEPYGLSITYPDGLRLALQLQFDNNVNVVTEVLPGGRASANDGTPGLTLTSFALVIGGNFVVVSGNVSGNMYTYVAVINQATADMDGVTTSRVVGAVMGPSTNGWASIPVMARVANGTQAVQKTQAAMFPVLFPIPTSSVSNTGVWSERSQDYVRVLPRLVIVSNTGAVSQPSNPVLLAPGAMGWDEQVVIDGDVYKPCVVHVYGGTTTTLLVKR